MPSKGQMAEMNSSRGSGSINSGSARQGGRGAGGKQVGGGGRIANRPPPSGGVGRGGSRNDSASNQGLAIDTTSSIGKQQLSNADAPDMKNQTQPNLGRNDSHNRSQNTANLDGDIPTPRNLQPLG